MPAVGGNVARFINHSCTPNCYTQVIGDMIWIRAARNIRSGEELTYDYCTDGDGHDPLPLPPRMHGHAVNARRDTSSTFTASPRRRSRRRRRSSGELRRARHRVSGRPISTSRTFRR